MNETAFKLIKEAVMRALRKSPSDISFYQDQVDDPLQKEEYRRALREAIEESKSSISKQGKP